MTKKSFVIFLIMTFLVLASAVIYLKSAKQEDKSNKVSLPQNEDPGPTTSYTPPQNPSPQASPEGIGVIHKDIRSTIFWVGEKSSSENNFISNEASAWDRNWQENFGGIDEPNEREGYFPKDFRPKQNPFYFALPYNDLDESSNFKQSAKQIPWYNPKLQEDISQLKNKWVWISANNTICFAQWEDVGPGSSDDFGYVFGGKMPENSFSAIDLSPAVRDCLQIGNRAIVTWQFIDEENVSKGPWKQIISRN